MLPDLGLEIQAHIVRQYIIKNNPFETRIFSFYKIQHKAITNIDKFL